MVRKYIGKATISARAFNEILELSLSVITTTRYKSHRRTSCSERCLAIIDNKIKKSDKFPQNYVFETYW